jgi:hypothetical protein
LLPTGELEADDTIHAWLTEEDIPQRLNDRLSLKHYLAADDSVFTYHIQRWQSSPDPILADLCRRFTDRDLFKVVDVTHLPQEAQTTLLQKALYWLTNAGLAADYYSGLRVSFSRGYTLYQRGIKFLTPNGLEEISNLSPLVRTLTNPYQRTWLIYHRAIESALQSVLATRTDNSQ